MSALSRSRRVDRSSLQRVSRRDCRPLFPRRARILRRQHSKTLAPPTISATAGEINQTTMKYPEQPGHQGTDTSKAAAADVARTTEQLRARVLATLANYGPSTADEVAKLLEQHPLSIRPRLTELKRMGKIRDTGIRRLSFMGKFSAVMAVGDVAGGAPVNKKALRARVTELETENAALRLKLARWGRPSNLERIERAEQVRERQQQLL